MLTVNGTAWHGTDRVHPIVAVLRDQGRTQTWLARRIGRSHAYTNRVLNGLHPAVPAFRARCAALLGLDEATLFHPADTSSAAPASEDGASVRAGTAVEAVYGASEITSRRSA